MITITKRVSLDFLGEEYSDSYIVLKTISMSEYEGVVKKSQANADDNLKAIPFIIEQVTSRFVSGQIQQDGKMVDLTAANLTELPAEVFVTVFSALSGAPSPKD